MKNTIQIGALTIWSIFALPIAGVTQTTDGAGAVTLTASEATARIDLAARQRMLIERMAKSVCFAENGTHVWDNELYLQGARVSFEIAHNAISGGDENLGIAAETDRNFREIWRELDLTWRTLNRVYTRFVEQEELTEQDMLNIISLTESAHEQSDEIVIQMRSNYAQFIGAGGLGTTILIDLYSKQKELLQEISKDICMTANGLDADESIVRLNTSLSYFQASIDGFRTGIPTLGIPAPPTERISIQLDRADERWEEIRPLAETVAAGNTLTAQELSALEFGIDEVLREIDRVVFLLVDHISNPAQ